MEALLEPHIHTDSYPQNNQPEEGAQDLFNQIDLPDSPMIASPTSPVLEAKPVQGSGKKEHKNAKKAHKAFQLDSDEENGQQILETPKSKSKKHKSKPDKKQRKKEKKMRKQLKKQKEQGLKRLRKDAEDAEESNGGKWSGESSESLDEDSGASSDSLLERLNPSKIRKSKLRTTEKKEGFSLKELGNDAEVNLESDDSEYNEKKKTLKAKAEKKVVANNDEILKKFVELGLCVDEQRDDSNNQKHEYDNGIDQIMKLKGAKKKGPRIANKLFQDLQINEEEQNKEPIPKHIQLEIKPRVSNGPSHIASSFLAKVQKIKKVRGMESEMLNEEYQKLIQLKAKESMIKLISQKELEEAEDIELDVQVPEVVKGKGQINNSLFLKKISSAMSSKQVKQVTPKKQVVKQVKHSDQKMKKISRFEFFKSISDDVKRRRSMQFSDELIKNNFRKTNLDEIEEMRKKNEEKKKKQMLGVEDQDEDEENDEDFKPDEQIRENKLGFMNFAIEVQDSGEKKSENQLPDKPVVSVAVESDVQNNKTQQNQQAVIIGQQINKEKQNQQEEEDKNEKMKNYAIELNDAMPQKQYKKLLQLEEGSEVQNEQESQMKDQAQESEENQNNEDGISEQDKQESQQHNNESKSEKPENAEPVEIEVDLEVSNINNEDDELLEEENQDEQQEEEEKPSQQEMNEEYKMYLEELEAEGIRIKKTNKPDRPKNKIDINQYIIESKENAQNRENGGSAEENEARKQFRKLRKFAIIMKSKKINEIKMKRAGQFFEEEAEEGSDDENHDNLVKQIDYNEEAKEFEGLDLDADLAELIDDVDVDGDEDEAFRKFMEDEKLRDREELKRILNGDFKRRTDAEPLIEELDEDQKNRIKRMENFQEYLKKKQEEEGKGLYIEDANDENQDGNSNDKAGKNENEEEDMEMVDEINEENLKRYFDEVGGETFKSKVTNLKPKMELPESYQRQKKTVMRNTIKAKEPIEGGIKLKKTSSRLNEMIMKNKQKMKPLSFLNPFARKIK